jgi:hypothetical protein
MMREKHSSFVVPANAGTHTPCPCDLKQVAVEILPFNKNGRWLWVPAFAGTTG